MEMEFLEAQILAGEWHHYDLCLRKMANSLIRSRKFWGFPQQLGTLEYDLGWGSEWRWQIRRYQSQEIEPWIWGFYQFGCPELRMLLSWLWIKKRSCGTNLLVRPAANAEGGYSLAWMKNTLAPKQNFPLLREITRPKSRLLPKIKPLNILFFAESILNIKIITLSVANIGNYKLWIMNG